MQLRCVPRLPHSDPLHWAGVTLGRIRIAAGLLYKTAISVLPALAAANLMLTTATLLTDAYVHGATTGVTAGPPHLAHGGLRRKAGGTTPVGRALREDRRVPQEAPLRGALVVDRRVPHKFPSGGALLAGRRVPQKALLGAALVESRPVAHKAPLGGALVVGRRVPHKVPPGGALLDGRRAPHASLRGGARHDDLRTTIGARTADFPPVTDLPLCTPHLARGLPPGGRRRTRCLSRRRSGAARHPQIRGAGTPTSGR